jgi:hypothetical protein
MIADTVLIKNLTVGIQRKTEITMIQRLTFKNINNRAYSVILEVLIWVEV